jgi:hypothetical protein
MPPTGDEPLGASLEAPAQRAKASPRRRRHGLVAHYPGVEEDTMSQTPGALTPGRKLGFIVASGALVWLAIFGLIALLR